MKRKPDLPFIVFLVLIIAGGIYLHKLTLQKNKLIQENKYLIQVIENQHILEKTLENLYFQSVLPQAEKPDLKDKFCLSWTASVTDSVEYKLLSKVGAMLSDFPPEKICFCLPAQPSQEVKSLLNTWGIEIKICPEISGKTLFYVDATGKIKGFFEVSPYSVFLLERYFKLLRENYLSE